MLFFVVICFPFLDNQCVYIHVYMCKRLLERDQISHTQSMGSKRGRTNRANVHTKIYMKKSFKTQRGKIPIDPAILAAVGHRFIAKKTNKTEH